ncbi:hypothetical protein DERF_004035 [Dermatophagoides farinae]|uniref:Uncharacterized protein n=1 Tax=Dermatophagoides farinae TaxID=6954 RepID=A0A922LBZ5_DERFA|nr:hypothetical protein DERF_004035 [Dermatophagoides farinae]
MTANPLTYGSTYDRHRSNTNRPWYRSTLPPIKYRSPGFSFTPQAADDPYTDYALILTGYVEKSEKVCAAILWFIGHQT